MADIPAGQASFRLRLKDDVTPQVRGLRATLGRALSALTRLRTLAAAAVAAAPVVALQRAASAFARYGDNIGKTAVRTDLSTAAVQELGFAAELSGTNLDSLSQALFRARRRVGNATTGTGPAVRALKELGLNAKELSRLQPERLFERLVDALAGVGNEARRNQLAFEIFGDNFRQIQPLIDAGVGGMRGMRAEARRLGLVLSSEDVKAAENLTDAFTRLQRVAQMAFVRLGAALEASGLSDALNGLAEILALNIRLIERLNERINFGKVAQVFSQRGAAPLFRGLANILPQGSGLDVLARWFERGAQLGPSGFLRMARTANRVFAAGEREITFGDARGPDDYLRAAASRQLLSGFAASLFGGIAGDPKKEEKEMVRLLDQLNRKPGLVVGP